MKIFPRRPPLLREQYRWKKKSKLLQSVFLSFQTVLFISVLVALGSMFHLWQWMSYLQHGYQIQSLEKEKSALEHQLTLMEVEINYLTRPQRLEAFATQRLGMKRPKTTQYFLLDTAKNHD
ncbi:cell division protein FtsL [Deltaproteobacteria bacterium TL4]